MSAAPSDKFMNVTSDERSLQIFDVKSRESLKLQISGTADYVSSLIR